MSVHFSLVVVMMLYSVSLTISQFFQNELLLRIASNSTVSFGQSSNGEVHVQHVVSIIYSWKAYIQYAVLILLIALSGPWSDSHGRRRKPLIFIPIFGQVLTDAVCILNVYFWTWPPQIAAIFKAITPGLFGSQSVFWVGALSYTSDNSPNEMRTLRYGIINAFWTISTLIGKVLAEFLNVNRCFYGAFMVPIVLNLTALSVGWLFFKDTSVPYDKSVVWLKPKIFLKNYVSVFKGGTISFPISLIMLLLCQCVLMGIVGGEYNVIRLFLRNKFHLYKVKYSYFAALKMSIIFIGTLFSVTVLSRRLKIDDAIIGCIACIFDIMAAMCYVFATEPWQIYIIPIVEFFHGTAVTVCISLKSKIITEHVRGRLNSVQAICTLLLSLVIIPMYSAVYNFTFEYFAGAVYLLNVVLTIPILMVFVILYCTCKYLWTKETTKPTETVFKINSVAE